MVHKRSCESRRFGKGRCNCSPRALPMWYAPENALPPFDTYVLLKLKSRLPVSMPCLICVGYLHHNHKRFHTPGITAAARDVLAWCDCLPEGFSASVEAGLW